MEFARHAFPQAAIADIEVMGSPTLFHNMSYVAAQVMFYIVAGAWRIQLLGEMEAARVGCDSLVTEFGHHVYEFSDDFQHSEQRYQLLV